MTTVFITIPFGLFFIIGLLNAIWPRKMWKISESWKATREPTDAYFLVRRIVSFIVMVINLAIILTPYILSKL